MRVFSPSLVIPICKCSCVLLGFCADVMHVFLSRCVRCGVLPRCMFDARVMLTLLSRSRFTSATLLRPSLTQFDQYSINGGLRSNDSIQYMTTIVGNDYGIGVYA